METKIYSYDGQKYTQKPLLTGAFENALAILDQVGLSDMISEINNIKKILDKNSGTENAGNKFEVDLEPITEATIKALTAIGRAKALSYLLESLLTLSPEEAKLVPMSVARSAVTDFFILNLDWLPISPRYFAALNLYRAIPFLSYKQFLMRSQKKTGKIRLWLSTLKSRRA